MGLLMAFLLLLSANAFSSGRSRQRAIFPSTHGSSDNTFLVLGTPEVIGHQNHHHPTYLFSEPTNGPKSGSRDISRSGTKRERLDKLAAMEDSRIETDKGVVVKAAGAFGILLVLGILVGVGIQI